MKKCVIIILTFLYIIQGTAKDTREIIIRGDSAFPPYEFINDKGEPDGFNIDLTRAIMDELKLPYDLQLEDWSDILQQFEKGEIDLITGMAKFESPQNGPSKLSKAHSYINYKFVCRKDALIQHTKDLSHKNVIVQRYALPHKKLKDMGYDSHLIPVDNMMEGLNMLSEGKGDMAICLDNMAQYIIYKDGLTNLSIIDSEWPLQEYCFVGSDTQLLEQINSALLKLKKNGVYDRIHVKWLGEKPTFSIPTWLYFLLGALLLTALLLSIFVTIYKKRAQKGEILLKEENEKLNALLLENKNFLNRYQTVFNTTLVGLSYYDKKGILVSVNDEMARLFQMDNKNKLLKEQLSIYANPVLRNHGIIDEQNQIHEFHGILKYDMRKEQCPQYFARFTPFDQIFYFKMDVTPIKDQEGEPYRYFNYSHRPDGRGKT
ncbi:transporter substrate-binding domain-containing protein [Bacteroides salyersiae]|nr:transporter substrate-binding domain-containing protein [Bacteroides salyersiae]